MSAAHGATAALEPGLPRSEPLPRLVLASGSPRRRELLSLLGLDFEIRPADIDETPAPGEGAEAYVLRLAREKANVEAGQGELVLAADTVVVLDGHLLGKPDGPREAAAMLARLSGREHWVATGVALSEVSSGRRVETVELSRVTMTAMSRMEIEWYVATGEPLDRAGSYAIQGKGALFVEQVSGNYSNVVGLPLPATSRLFAALGYDLRWFGAT